MVKILRRTVSEITSFRETKPQVVHQNKLVYHAVNPANWERMDQKQGLQLMQKSNRKEMIDRNSRLDAETQQVKVQ